MIVENGIVKMKVEEFKLRQTFARIEGIVHGIDSLKYQKDGQLVVGVERTPIEAAVQPYHDQAAQVQKKIDAFNT